LSKAGRYAQSTEYVEKSDQIMRRLVSSAPENKQQRGILAAVLETNGITLGNSRKLDAALKHFEEARASFELLDKTGSPGHEISIHALTCTEKMGEAASHIRNSNLAAEYFHQVLKGVEPELAEQNPDPGVPYLAADSYSGLGDLELREARQPGEPSAKRRERLNQARAWYLKSLEAWHKIEHPLPVAPSGFDAGDPVKVVRNLQLCDAALSSLH
jgi:tetratricopeptide (TPR) repeat protein